MPQTIITPGKSTVKNAEITHITHGTANTTKKIGVEQYAQYVITEITMRTNAEKSLDLK